MREAGLFNIVFVLIGKMEEIGGVTSYIATPEGDYAKDTVVLFLTDVFGHQLVNSKVSLKFCVCGRIRC